MRHNDYEEMTIIGHMALVVSMHPLLLTHRRGVEGTFVERQPFSEVDLVYGPSRVSYYLPRILGDIYNGLLDNV